MIVYRKQERQEFLKACLEDIIARLDSFERNGKHEDAVEAFIELGEVETGIVDSLSAGADDLSQCVKELRRISIMAGKMLYASWQREIHEARGYASELRALIKNFKNPELPEIIKIREPEGYAHYGVYPEAYMESAKLLADSRSPQKAVCVGLRSIGTSLSAAVAGVLEASGWAISSFTLRPRRHPFDRKIFLGRRLEDEIRSKKSGLFLIVDEGPGLSGSSFCNTALKLIGLGVERERIIFFPSWAAQGKIFFSSTANMEWGRFEKFASDFAAVRKKTLAMAGAPVENLTDISGGGWRSLFFEEEAKYPAVNPFHEKYKYIAAQEKTYLLKFAGLGKYGRRKLLRAQKLHGAGFIQEVSGFANGFIVSEFIDARPLSASEATPALIDFAARYFSHLKRHFSVGASEITFDELMEMIRINIASGLGREIVEEARGFIESFRKTFAASEPVAIDGRVLPFEWLSTGAGFIKADSLDHHADQFFPRCQDMAWDIAGFIAEFMLDERQKALLLGRYSEFSKDDHIGARLPFYMIAYLSFRLGYSVYAQDELKGTPDGEKFKEISNRYAAQLRTEIKRYGANGKKD